MGEQPLEARALAWTRVRQLAEAGAVALLPVGSTEAHGPHLPLGVDVVIAEEVCRRAARRLHDAGQSAVIFPPVVYTLTDYAAEFAGTVSIPAETSHAYLTEVVLGIARWRFAAVAVVNHHVEPAHFKVVHKAAKAAQARTATRILVPDHRRPPVGPLLGDEFMTGGSHAGRYETSLMLAAAPALVDETARRALPELAVDLPARIQAGAKTFHECGGPDAYFGAPASASADEGNRLFELLAEATVAAIRAS